MQACKVYKFKNTYPNNIAHVPVVNMPALNKTFGPIRFKYLPYTGLIINTTSSKTPNTNPYSVAVAPFFSA